MTVVTDVEHKTISLTVGHKHIVIDYNGIKKDLDYLIMNIIAWDFRKVDGCNYGNFHVNKKKSIGRGTWISI